MPRINRSALVPFSAPQMFELVNDIERYPEFMAGCKSARVVSRTDTELVGELKLAKAGISQQFTTRNELDPPRSITMHLVQGSFAAFNARWSFTDLSGQGCKINLDMEFEFASSLVDLAAKALFNDTANNLVDALVAQANRVYGS